ncbi:hypothetical protein Tco_1002553 [Tanacetum coccineum]|uniref:Uncharacterized protein n=1 Tax=Tanacetum coccineum TaxID=301880 RepID=A0ABQ5F6T9_9ASTR
MASRWSRSLPSRLLPDPRPLPRPHPKPNDLNFQHHIVRYEPKSTTSAPKKGATNVGNASKSTSMLKTTITSSKNDNIITSNSDSALNDEKQDEEEDVKNVYDESANLFPNTKTGGSSSFTAAAVIFDFRLELVPLSLLVRGDVILSTVRSSTKYNLVLPSCDFVIL